MVSFRFNEIPPGVSEEQITLDADSLGIQMPGISSITLDLRFNKADERLRIQCLLTTDITLSCDRSLDSFNANIKSTYEVIFQKNVEKEQEGLSGSLRRLEISSNTIDITSELRDTVLLSIPVKKIHPRYFQDGKLNDFEAFYGEVSNEHDPRWDALEKLRSKFNNN